MKRSRFPVQISALFLCAFSLNSAAAESTIPNCADAEEALIFWRPVRLSARDDTFEADQLALPLLDCLASPNSELRDSIGYEVLTFWLRSDALSETSRSEMLQQLEANLSKRGEPNSLVRSFSALIISEILRADDQVEFMSQADRLALLEETVRALALESDYRGLVEGLGWVHPIAHMADVLWRFSLHNALDAEQARLVLQGVRSKAGSKEEGYAFNEGDRLARPVAALISRQVLADSELVDWLASFDTPTSSESWFDAFASPAGMLELHNSKLFIRALADQLVRVDISSAVRAKLDELVALFTSTV